MFAHQRFCISTCPTQNIRLNGGLLPERLDLLKRIYTRSTGLDKGSQAYNELAKSGRCWEEFYRPFDWTEKDVGMSQTATPLYCPKLKDNVTTGYQNEYRKELEAIDTMKDYFSPYGFLDHVKTPLAHQNCLLEGNSLTTAESELIAANLLPRFSPLDFNPTLVDQELPAAEVVLPGGKPEAKDHIVEVRNSIVAFEYIRKNLCTPGRRTSAEGLKLLHRLLMKDLPMEKFQAWDQIQNAGDYRGVVMQARGMPLTIYPVGFYFRMPSNLLLIADIHSTREKYQL